MHAVARLVFNGLIDNIQTSWVKMGQRGVAACLKAGANDLGGTLMNETITRAAGAAHGQEWSPRRIEAEIRTVGREPCQRSTTYGDVPAERRSASLAAQALSEPINTPARKYERKTSAVDLVRNAVIASG